MKNAILITIDCLRWDFLDLDKQKKLKNMRRIVDNSHLFTDVISCGPNTPSSFSSILTSTYPLMYGGYSYISDERLTIAEVLKNEGFATAGFHSNPHLLARYNYSKGFSTFFDYQSIGGGITSLQKLIGNFRRMAKEKFRIGPIRPLANESINKISDNPFFRKIAEILRKGKSPYEDAGIINNRIRNWVENDLDIKGRFFLWAHYMEPHLPYILRKDNLKISPSKISDLFYRIQQNRQINQQDAILLRCLYMQQLEFLDSYLGELLDYLDGKQLLNDAVLIVTSDHGEAFFEHGYQGHAKTSGYDGCRLEQPVLKVPFLVYSKKFRYKLCKKRISLLDLSPTLLDLLQVPKPDNFLGQSAFCKDRVDEVIVSEYRNEMSNGKKYNFFAFIADNKKYIYDSYKNEKKVFDLDKDPQETKDIFQDDGQYQEALAKLLSEHNQIIRSSHKPLPDKEVDSEIKKRLESLGYM